MPRKKVCYLATTLTICGLIASNPIFAATTTTTDPSATPHESRLFDMPSWLHPVLTASGGMAIAQVGKSQTLTMSNDFSTYQYANNGAHSSQVFWGGFLGTEIPLRPQWGLQLGIGYYAPSTFYSGTGILTQGIDAPSSDQYPYNYKVISRQLLAEGKLLWSVKERYHPYASLGIGAAFNRAYSYAVTIPAFTTFSPQFTNHSNTSFSYNVGVGMDVDINKNWRAGAGYRFTDLGKADLGLGQIDVTPFTSALTQSHLYAQEVMAQLTYLIS